MDFKMSSVTENAVLEEEDNEASKENDLGRQNKSFLFKNMDKSASSENSNHIYLTGTNKNDVRCFLDLLDVSRDSSANENSD